MTEKRFWYDFEDCNGAKIVDFVEDKEYSLETIGDFRKIEDVLNEQHEEIEELKSENKELIELIRHCYENWSEEKKKMVGEISNGLLGD